MANIGRVFCITIITVRLLKFASNTALANAMVPSAPPNSPISENAVMSIKVSDFSSLNSL